MTPPDAPAVTDWLRRQVAWLYGAVPPATRPPEAAPLVEAAVGPIAEVEHPALKPANAKPATARPRAPKRVAAQVPAVKAVKRPTVKRPTVKFGRPASLVAVEAPPVAGLSLALQGGGAIGAFTWGVLDRLLEAEVPIARITGASAGAFNGVVLAAALAKDGPAGARKALAEAWKRVSDAGGMSGRTQHLDLARQMFSPYQLNPFDVNPIRDILMDAVDWPALTSRRAPTVFVSATRIADGQARIFTGATLTIDAVLASAALPGLSRAVEIDGEAYWDGGYSANPPLDPLLTPGGAPDILLVRLNPTNQPGVPMTVRTIAERVNQIVFDRPLLDALDRLAPVFAEGRFRLHQLNADRVLDGLPPGSARNLDWDFLTGLRDAGRLAASEWLDGIGAALVVETAVVEASGA